MQWGFFFDQTRCTACQTCAVSCKDWHDVPAGPASWRRVRTREEGRFPQVAVSHLSLSCLHCARPACRDACPTHAITKRRDNGVVVVDRAKCLPGCRLCLAACPYEAPQYRDGATPMEKCDLCLERIVAGENPICVDSCPMRALSAGPLRELRQRYGRATAAPGFPDPAATRPSLLFRAKG